MQFSMIKSIKNQNSQKRKIKKLLNAHQQAPLDYISPWQAHHHQVIMSQYQSPDNSHIKNSKNQNVVQNFLSKIRKTQNMRKLHKNISMQQNSNIFTASHNGQQHNDNDKLFKPKNSKNNMTLMRNTTYDAAQNARMSKLQIEAQDVGFGKLHYSKGSQKQMKKSDSFTKNIIKDENYMKNKTFYTQANNKTQEDQNLQIQTLSPARNRAQSFSYKRTLPMEQKNSIFTDQQMLRPQEVVFIKKKKNNQKLMTVVDINETAQQFYEQQIRDTQQRMLTKYRKLASRSHMNSRIQNRSIAQQYKQNKHFGQNRRSKINQSRRKYLTQSSTQVIVDPQAMKRKYCFLDSVKDETIMIKMQNMMRYYPSLANSILIPK